MTKILEEVTRLLPPEADIVEACFEGANIVLYTKNKKFFLEGTSSIKEIVDNIKKRIELRIEHSLCMEEEETKETIAKILEGKAGKTNIIFDYQRSIVIIETENPGVLLTNSGELAKEIRKQTFWTLEIKRIPPIRSQILESIRQVLYENNDYRRKFLNKVGKRVYDGWTRTKREGWIRISFLGSAREVGRSAYLLQTPESRVLLDCGLNVASSDNAFPYLDTPEFNIQDLDAVIISHSHIDHVGMLPYLFKMGYRGPVYMTYPTRDVSALLCLDGIDIQQKEGKPGLYETKDIKEMVKHTICLDYGEVTDITPDIRITLYNAGHILGSSLVHMHIGNGLHNFMFTGDFNYETSNLLGQAATRFPRLESVMMESTYGTKHDKTPTRRESEEELIKIIINTVKRKGKVLMPVLGVGRSQEVMLIVEKIMELGKIPHVPIYLQGMVWDIVAIHTAYPSFLSPKVRKSIFQYDHNPFLSPIFKRVGSQKEMQEIIDSAGPYIVMATSGMLTGGASMSYLEAFAENPKNTLILTCYQGVGSLGRRIQEGEREIYIQSGANKQEKIDVKMDVHTLSGFSGHSSFKQLTAWVRNLQPKPRKIIMVHGDQSRCVELASVIYQENKIETQSPKLLESIRLR